MKSFFKDFRDFIMRGNVMDLAIGIIIGAAFSSVVNSVVNNLMMPPLGLLFGNTDFGDLYILLKPGQEPLPTGATLEMASEVGAVTLNYGQFLTDLISFIILGFGVFLIVKGIRSFKKPEVEEQKAPTEKDCQYCQKSIPIKATRCPYCTSRLEESTAG